MEAEKKNLRTYFEQILPWLVLAILLTYTYSKFFVHPYGFRFDTTDGRIMYMFVQQPEPTLKVDDQLVKIGPVGWEDFQNNLWVTFFDGVKPGEVVPVVIERDGRILTIPWRYPGLNMGDFIDQLPSEWLMAIFFWLVGTLTLLLLRPKDVRWRLLVGFNYLTAIWLIAGSGNSSYHTWGSALVLRIAIWLSLPVYLHLHWVFPRPLGKLPVWLVGGSYAIALVLVVAQAFQFLPQSLYYLGFIAALLGSLILLIVHAVRQPEVRRDLRLLLLAAFLALVPSIAIGIISGFVDVTPGVASLGMLSFPLIPFSYLYAAYRLQLGESEVRLNRLISLYLFLILLGTLMLPLIALTATRTRSPGSTMLVEITAGISAVLLTIFGFPRFQAFVERRWLGIRLLPENLLESYSARITTSNSVSALVQLLQDEVLPSLLVRQFAFLQFENHSTRVLLDTGIDAEQIPGRLQLSTLMDQMGKYRSPERMEGDRSWVRLVLPLKVGDALIGLWLFGRRDPEDQYTQAEIPILRSLADQTSIALSNIQQTERLRAIYQADVDRYEEERLHLALELHDSILNELAVMMMALDDPDPSPKFQQAYDSLAQHLREIVSNLRPPMLNYGLKPAIDALAEDLMERSSDTMRVNLEVQADGTRYPSKAELHLFRIVQEASENALRHAHANQVSITGRLDAQGVDMVLADDGVGFDLGDGLDFEALMARKHFGLAGMIERATLIGAQIRVDSAPKTGTRIQILWNSDPAESAN